MDEPTVNPGLDHLRQKMNPPDLTPLRPPPGPHQMPGTTPIPIAQPRPMPPPPPRNIDSPIARGVPTCPQLIERPKSPYALELEEKARQLNIQGKPRQCPKCGGTTMINIKRNSKNQIIEYHACPDCVDCT